LLRSSGAVLAGFLVIAVSTTAIDIVLHAAGVFPPWGQPNPDGPLVLATTYRIICSILGCWLTARLAPSNPMKHALALGVLGIVVGLVGAAATWNADLGGRWYSLVLVAVALPCAWAGGRLHFSLSRS
jgi:hypothetical protein